MTSDDFERSYTTQGNTFYYDARQFTEEQIKAMDFTEYINSDEGDGWRVYRDLDGDIVVY